MEIRSSYPSWNSQVSTSSQSAYPSTSMGADSYPKLPLSGAPGFTTEPQEMPLHTSIAPPMPLPLPANDQSQSSLRSHYSYTTTAPQLPGSSVTIGGAEGAFNMPRYVDSNPRPSKSPRQSGHQSVHSSGSVTNTDSSSDYRYGSYRGANGGGSDASQPQAYPPPSSWTTTSPEQSSSLAYATNDGRSYSFSHEPYKSGSLAIPPLKQEPPSSSVYSGGSRSSFDTMNNYSWSAA